MMRIIHAEHTTMESDHGHYVFSTEESQKVEPKDWKLDGSQFSKLSQHPGSVTSKAFESYIKLQLQNYDITRKFK